MTGEKHLEQIERSKGKWIKAFLTLLTLLVIAIFWSNLNVSEDSTGTDSGSFITSGVDKGNIAQFITATGTLRPVSVVIVGTQLSGTVSKLYVDYNDKVTKGQLLLELDPAIYISQVKQAKATLQAAKATMDLATSNRKRSESLFEKNFIQAAAYENEKQIEISSAAQYELALAQLEKAETDLRNTYIRSPIDGLVLKKDVDLGQTVAATFQTPELFMIAQDFSQMEVDTNISEADISWVKTGMKASFTVDSFKI
jgi:HlyD family secretion protein